MTVRFKKAIEGSSLALHKLLIAIHAVIADVDLNVSGDAEEIPETLKSAAEKVRPFVTLAPRHPTAGEVDHLPEVGIVPATEGNAGDKILFVHKAKSFLAENMVVVPAELVKTDPRLTEGVNAAHRPDACRFPDGKGGAG